MHLHKFQYVNTFYAKKTEKNYFLSHYNNVLKKFPDIRRFRPPVGGFGDKQFSTILMTHYNR
jgi:hypothetical protein